MSGWKHLAHIRIVKLDGNATGFRSAVMLRWWLPSALLAVPVVLLQFEIELPDPLRVLFPLFWIIDVLVIFGPERRCLHDLIAGTKVVETD